MMRTILAAVLCGLLMGACGRGYSQGERAGTVYKFSRKGLVWKSWEGELNLGGMHRDTDQNGNANIVANVWKFTVTDEGVATEVQKALEADGTVRVGYVQWLVSGCSMDTDYEVVTVIGGGAK